MERAMDHLPAALYSREELLTSMIAGSARSGASKGYPSVMTAILVASAIAACSSGGGELRDNPMDSLGTVRQQRVDTTAGPIVIEDVMDHDPLCFTQGLAIVDSTVYESSGLYGRSYLTSYGLGDGERLQRTEIADTLFAEGLAVIGDTIYLLTWRENTCLLLSRDGFEMLGSFRFEGEGWGLAWDGRRLVQSDGSEYLTFRDPHTFQPLSRVAVTASGSPLGGLNELECVSGLIYANVWPTDLIAVIDPDGGEVLDLMNASGLLTPAERNGVDVLNGIAWDPSSGSFLLTGKLWPKMFLARIGARTD